MFFVHKIKTENENYQQVIKKYFKNQKFLNYDLFLEKLKKINKNFHEMDELGYFKKDSEILFPEYFLKYYPTVNQSIRTSLQLYAPEHFPFQNPLNELNIFGNTSIAGLEDCNFNFLKYNIYFNIKNNESHHIKILTFLNIDCYRVDSKIDTFSYPNFNNHILIYKKYGVGKILFVPDVFFVDKFQKYALDNNMSRKNNCQKIGDNFCTNISSLLDKSNDCVAVETKFELNNNTNELQYIKEFDTSQKKKANISVYKNFNSEFQIFFNNLKNNGNSLIVLLNNESSNQFKEFINTTFGVSVSNDKFEPPNRDYNPSGILTHLDNYADMNVHYKLTLPQMLSSKMYSNKMHSNHNLDQNYLIIPDNAKLLPVRQLCKNYTELDVFNDLKNYMTYFKLDRIVALICCLFYSNYNLFKYVICFEKNFTREKNNLNSLIVFRLYYHAQWNEVIVEKNDAFKSFDLNIYLTIAICELFFEQKIDYSSNDLMENLDSQLENISTEQLINMFYGSVPVLNKTYNSKGLCLFFKKNTFSIKFINTINEKNICLDDENVWYPLQQIKQKQPTIMYQLKHSIEFNKNSVKDFILQNFEKNVILNLKSFIPVFIPDYFLKKKKEPDFIYHVKIWIYSNLADPFILKSIKISKFLYNEKITELEKTITNGNFNCKSLKYLDTIEALSVPLINIQMKSGQVVLLLIENNKNRQQDKIIIRVCFDEE